MLTCPDIFPEKDWHVTYPYMKKGASLQTAELKNPPRHMPQTGQISSSTHYFEVGKSFHIRLMAVT